MPACKGKKLLPVFDAERAEPVLLECCHCQGKGTIPAEVAD